MRTRNVFGALLLSSAMLLSGCGAIDLSSIDLPWESPAPQPAAPTAMALRVDAGDAVPVPDGMQREDLQAPFGTPQSDVRPTQRGSL